MDSVHATHTHATHKHTHALLREQVTKHHLETQKEFDARQREEELKDRMLAAKREVGRGFSSVVTVFTNRRC